MKYAGNLPSCPLTSLSYISLNKKKLFRRSEDILTKELHRRAPGTHSTIFEEEQRAPGSWQFSPDSWQLAPGS